MNLGVTLKSAEKVFGPALPGQDRPENTLSAIWYSKGKGKKFAGVIGVQDEARFYIHFPVEIDWTLLTSKKGTPDFINDLAESGPQGEQGRRALVAEFLEKQATVQEKRRLKKQKEELVLLRPRLAAYAGDQQAILTLGSESFSLPVKITIDKKGKLKIVASL